MQRKTKTTSGKKKRQRKTQEERCSYVIEVINSYMRYNFCINRSKKFNAGPYSESMSIELTGKMLTPAKVAGKDIHCTIYGSRENDEKLNSPEKYEAEQPTSLSYLQASRDHCLFYCWIPASTLFSIGQLLQSKEFRFIELFGSTLFRNSASIDDITFTKEPEAE